MRQMPELAPPVIHLVGASVSRPSTFSSPALSTRARPSRAQYPIAQPSLRPSLAPWKTLFFGSQRIAW
jgi:hypothetical protein